jgi:hypothetical protein
MRPICVGSRLVTPLLALLVGTSAAAAGCVGNIGDRDAGQGTCATCGPQGPKAEGAAALETTRFPRLSHLQWENTIQQLFHLSEPTGLSASFTGDPLGGVFDNNESSLLVTPGLWADYQTAAEQIADRVVDDAALLALLVPAGAPDDLAGKRLAFIEELGKRAYRRPLTQAETDAYAALFDKGPQLVDGVDDFAKGARLVIQGVLQSPYFVYRVEASNEVVQGLIPLSGWEVASKLSYMLWNSMPDDELFAAAESGELGTPEGVKAQAERLLADDRSRAMVAAFHEQLFDYHLYEDLYKDETLFPQFSPELGFDMQREAEMFIEDVVFASEGGIEQILTEPYTFVNAPLAAIYGLDGSYGSDFQRVDLDPNERAGLLTRVGFLASNATKREQHSIKRGVFVNHRITCAPLPPPPDNVPPLPAADGFKTNRERVETHTGEGTCGESCHGIYINPAGFAFEHYNALGQFNLEENGYPVNAADTYPLDSGPISYEDAIDFSALLGAAEEVHECYARHWLQYSYGRKVQEGDEPTLPDLATASRQGAKSLILALTQTYAFRTRAPVQETP